MVNVMQERNHEDRTCWISGIGQEHAVRVADDGAKPDPALSHTGQSAMATIPEPRVEGLCKIYKPKKITLASLELVDTPGLSRSHEGSAARLAMIREAGCLILVVDAFGRANPETDLRAFDEDLTLADMEIVTSRITRVEESLRKPLPKTEHESLAHELATLKTVLESLEAGKPLRESGMTEDQLKVTRAFRLFGEKPRVVIFNTADDESKPERFTLAKHRRNARSCRSRRPGNRTVEDDARGSGRVRAGDECRWHRSRCDHPDPDEDIGAAAVF